MFGASKFRIGVYATFILAIVVGFIVLAISKGGGSGGGAAVTNVTIWSTLPSSVWTAMNEHKSGLTVSNATYYSIDSSKLYSQYLESVANGRGPDLLIIPFSLLNQFKGKYVPLPFASYPERQFADQFVDGAQVLKEKGTFVGLPLMVDPEVIYINKNHFTEINQLSAPKTWSEVYTLVEKLTKKEGINIIRSGVALGGSRNIENLRELLSMLFIQSNPNLTSSYEKEGVIAYTFDNSKTESPLSYYLTFSNPFSKYYSWNESLKNSIDAFASEDTSMYFGLGSDYPRIREKNPNLNFDIAVVPQTTSNNPSTYGELYIAVVPKSTHNAGASFGAASTLASIAAAQQREGLVPYVPVHRALLAQTQTGLIRPVLYRSAIIFKTWRDSNPTKTEEAMVAAVSEFNSGKYRIADVVNRLTQRINLGY